MSPDFRRKENVRLRGYQWTADWLCCPIEKIKGFSSVKRPLRPGFLPKPPSGRNVWLAFAVATFGSFFHVAAAFHYLFFSFSRPGAIEVSALRNAFRRIQFRRNPFPFSRQSLDFHSFFKKHFPINFGRKILRMWVIGERVTRQLRGNGPSRCCGCNPNPAVQSVECRFGLSTEKLRK